jgi:uncharacterized membrane protein YbaN (DUF454 family)
MIVVYLWLINKQGDRPAAWFLAGLAVAALLAAYGSAGQARGRRPALIVSGVLLLALGLLGILSIGLPVIAAGVLAIVAAATVRTSRSAE